MISEIRHLVILENNPLGFTLRTILKKVKQRFLLRNQDYRRSIKNLFEFKGIAEGLRILTNDHPSNREGGLRLTYTVLGSFTKYPKESLLIFTMI